MPTASIHIGAPKCASSLIQMLLAEPDVLDILPAQPALGALFSSFFPVMDAEDYFTIVNLDMLRDSLPDHDFVMSCENMFGMHTHRPNTAEETVRAIWHVFAGWDVRLLMFVRRQDSYIESVYGQDVKRQETRGFEAYLAEMMLDNLHWDRLADTYAAFDLTVLPFEAAAIRTGGYRDFIDGLFRWMGVEAEAMNVPVVNPSLSREGLDVQLFANRVLDGQTAYELSRWLEKHCRKPPGEALGLIKAGLMERYRESNRRLFETYMPTFNPVFYLDG